jgi:hypothetical protein
MRVAERELPYFFLPAKGFPLDIPLALAGPAVDFQLPDYQITQLRNSHLGHPARITTRTEFS